MAELLKHLTADRRLYVTKDRTRVVEEGDPAGSWLLYAAGRPIGAGDIDRYGLEADESGRVVYDGCPTLPEPAAEPEPEEEPGDESESEEEEDGADDSDRNEDDVPEWTHRTSPEAYLRNYPNGENAELARAVIAAQDDGADGGS